MYRRILILTVIIILALGGLGWLGYRAITMHSQGTEGRRIGEFASVAQQIRLDVMRKLNDFIQAERNRPYMEYQFRYVPPEKQVSPQQQAMPLLRSPLSESIENDFAYGYFQINSSGNITTPYSTEEMAKQERSELKPQSVRLDKIEELARKQEQNISKNLLPVLRQGNELYKDKIASKAEVAQKIPQIQTSKGSKSRQSTFEMEIKQADSQSQVYQQQRAVVSRNQMLNSPASQVQQSDTLRQNQPPMSGPMMGVGISDDRSDMVQVRVEPFVTMVAGKNNGGIFDGQVFLVRHVQVEDDNFIQGFQLNEQKLLEQIKLSAARFMREGMDYKIEAGGQETPANGAAYTAVLNFEFGNVVLQLLEKDPGWIARQTRELKYWYFSIIGVVVAAVGAGLVSLWRNTHQQIILIRKKDDFISAVSHELRTPLTSIRIYSEMLENNWMKSDDKRQEYYRNMRQESERLTRLIENVLDFSRIQRKKKRYHFEAGDLNACIAATVEKMRPYARQAGFEIQTDFDKSVQTAYDRDAVMQIVINLIDNAVKYARCATDKTIYVRTSNCDGYVMLDVEDHGPGIPHRQRKKIFEEFYRCQDESIRETTGTGLGLALVKKFAEAHNGFVEILSSEPTGVVFRVALARINLGWTQTIFKVKN